MKRYNIIQTNNCMGHFPFVAKFSVIDGRVAPAGYPLGSYRTIIEGLSLENARITCDDLNALNQTFEPILNDI